LNDVSGRARYHAITHFNSQIYDPPNNGGVLGSIAYIEPSPALGNITVQDTYLYKAIHTIMATDWKDTYGLDLIQTMELDFHTYEVLVKQLSMYKELVAKTKNNLSLDKG